MLCLNTKTPKGKGVTCLAVCTVVYVEAKGTAVSERRWCYDCRAATHGFEQ